MIGKIRRWALSAAKPNILTCPTLGFISFGPTNARWRIDGEGVKAVVGDG
jgi:hypothetical protein